MPATTVQLAGNNIGGLVQGQYGTYVIASDGTYTVDSRDVAVCLAMGMSYIRKASSTYNVPSAPGAAAAGQIVASATLSNGALTIANQPDVVRQVNVRVDPGTLAITAGTCAVVYRANDGTTQTDTVSLATGVSTLLTKPLSKGVAHVSSATVAALAGGATPKIQLDTTAVLCVPVDPGAVDFAVWKENVDTADETVGTLSTTTLGGIAPTTAPNGTHTYAFGYSFTSPAA